MVDKILEELSAAMADAVEKAGKTTVQVKARNRIPASGILYAKNLVMTAVHVLEIKENIPVTFHDGGRTMAKLAGRDASTDIALLELEESTGEVAEPVTAEPRIGEIVLAIGRPSSAGIEASQGVISAIGGPVRTADGRLLERYIRSDTILYPGFSGGPMVGPSGQVIGMNTSGLGGGAAVTIPTGLAWRIADTLAQYGRIKRAYLGVRSQPVALPDHAEQADPRQQKEALLVVSVEPDSPASRSGIQPGDMILAIGETPVTGHDGLYLLLSTRLAGKTENVKILRDGRIDQRMVEFTENERE